MIVRRCSTGYQACGCTEHTGADFTTRTIMRAVDAVLACSRSSGVAPVLTASNISCDAPSIIGTGSKHIGVDHRVVEISQAETMTRPGGPPTTWDTSDRYGVLVTHI